MCRPVWQCPLCQTSYGNAEIEFLLLDVVNRKTMAYMLQDLQCQKCLQVKLKITPNKLNLTEKYTCEVVNIV